MTKKEEKEMKIDALNKKKDYLVQQIDSIANVKKMIQFPALVGRTVKSKKFHDGVINDFDGQYFVVKFDLGEKKYAFPDSFNKGFLDIDDEQLVNSCKKYGDLLGMEEQMKIDLKKLEKELVQALAY